MAARSTAAAVTTASVSVMSDHATFAMQMERAGFHVTESRDVEGLTASLAGADIVVVDLVGHEGKRGLVARLSTALDERVPVVLISADEVDVALLGPARPVHVVVPPVRADYLVARVRQILKSLPRPVEPDPQPGPVTPPGSAVPASAAVAPGRAVPTGAVPPGAATRASADAPPVASKPSNVTPMRGRERRLRRGAPAPAPAPAGRTSRSGQASTAASPVPATRSAAKAASSNGSSGSTGPGAKSGPSTPRPRTARAGAPAKRRTVDVDAWAPPTLDWRVMASQLAHCVRDVPVVAVVAQTMADELAAAAGADTVVIVREPDGVWRVEGGTGLRSFEWAQTLEDADWIVQAGREQYATLLVADTDAVRGDLVGTPLASRHQMVRTLSVAAPFLVCAAWDAPGDDQERVQSVVSAIKRHEAGLADAMALRDYVRSLAKRVEGLS